MGGKSRSDSYQQLIKGLREENRAEEQHLKEVETENNRLKDENARYKITHNEDVRVTSLHLGEKESLEAKVIAQAKQIDAMKCCANCLYHHMAIALLETPCQTDATKNDGENVCGEWKQKQ